MPNKNVRRTIWMPDSLWEKISSAAKRDNRTISSWLRDRALDSLKRENESLRVTARENKEGLSFRVRA